MLIPLWAVFGFSVAGLSALMMLLQERLQVEGLALAFWCKIACVLVTLPFVLSLGLPSDPLFYLFLCASALIWAVSDVIFYRSLPKIGAGVISRLLPSAIFPGFLLWFVVDPSLVATYAAKPFITALILVSFLLAAYFASRLKKCPVSMQAVRLLWFVILSATLGPVVAKTVTMYASLEQGPIAYTFIEACMMIAIWLAYLVAARPMPVSSLFSKSNAQAGMLIGAVNAGMVTFYVMGLYHVDNPGYMTALALTDSVIILFVYRAMGRQDSGDMRSGFGMAASAAALIVLKSRM